MVCLVLFFSLCLFLSHPSPNQSPKFISLFSPPPNQVRDFSSLFILISTLAQSKSDISFSINSHLTPSPNQKSEISSLYFHPRPIRVRDLSLFSLFINSHLTFAQSKSERALDPAPRRPPSRSCVLTNLFGKIEDAVMICWRPALQSLPTAPLLLLPADL